MIAFVGHTVLHISQLKNFVMSIFNLNKEIFENKLKTPPNG